MKQHFKIDKQEIVNAQKFQGENGDKFNRLAILKKLSLERNMIEKRLEELKNIIKA